MATKIYNAVSGTGAANDWTAGTGGTVGDDQITAGDLELSRATILSGGVQKVLAAPLANETDSAILASQIDSVKLYCNMMASGVGAASAKLAISTTSVLGYGSIYTPTSSYIDYDYTWLINPVTGLAWTWTNINSLCGGVCAITGGISGFNYRADKTWIEVTYTFGIGIEPNLLAFR
jgi:hypothetical protein